MKRLKWVVEDAEGKHLELCYSRSQARDSKKWYMENIFKEWMDAFKPPVKIIREEWELVGKKVVR